MHEQRAAGWFVDLGAQCSDASLPPLQVVGDAPAQTQPGSADNEMPAADGEFEFLGADEKDAPGGKGDGQGGAGGMQTLADATEEQAAASAHAASQQLEQQPAEPTAAAMEDDTPDDDAQHAADGAAADDVAEAQPGGGGDAAQRGAPPRRRDAASKREKGPSTADAAPHAPQETPGGEDTDIDGGAAAAAYGRALEPAQGDGTTTAVVSLHLQRTRLDDDAEEAEAPQSVAALTDDQVAALRGEAEEALAAWQGASQMGFQDSELAARAGALWTRFESLTAPLASELCEQLRQILEPTLAAKLQGDYRTGKRLNMRKIIPYLASEFRRDKIWLRRSKPSVRKYQVREWGPSALPLWHSRLGSAQRAAASR